MADQCGQQQQSTVIYHLPGGFTNNTCKLQLGADTSLLPVVMLGMLVTSVNLRQVRRRSHTQVRMYQSKLWTGVEIRQQTGKGERGRLEL